MKLEQFEKKANLKTLFEEEDNGEFSVKNQLKRLHSNTIEMSTKIGKEKDYRTTAIEQQMGRINELKLEMDQI